MTLTPAVPLSMIAAVLLAALQQTQVQVSVDSRKGTTVVVTSDAASDSAREAELEKRRTVVATDEQRRTAFLNADARGLLEMARAARIGQDSSLQAYESSTLQRLTLGLAVAKIGPERIFLRHEVAARVRWERSIGAQIDVTGRRTVIPMLGGPANVDIESVLSPVPYYPQRDALWIGLEKANPNASSDDIIHPLANSAEAYYQYRAGDSVSFTLPDHTTITLRELEVRPRVANWHAVVGSLWFDTRTGQLVRAAYRLSQPVDLLAGDDSAGRHDSGLMARAVLTPSTASITGVAVEYGLYQGRFWLPRSQVGEGAVRVGFVRVPLRIEEHFSYSGINALDTLPVVPPRDSARKPDSVRVKDAAAECAATGVHSVRSTRYGGTVPVVVRIPCDTATLAHSAELPKSIFDSGEEVFGDADRDALLAKAKSMVPNLPIERRAPRLDWGLRLLRYNRIEGISSGIDITQALGSAYALRLTPRIGAADRIPNAEITLSRVTGTGSIGLAGYRRLAAANDWGDPLSFGSGFSALLFGRDEGFYHRATGAELVGDRLFGRSWQWHLFSERQRDAAVRTNASLARAFGSDGFNPSWNIAAPTIDESGALLRNVSTFGLDPSGFRLSSDLRLEAAGGDRDYGRAALDLTLSHPLGRVLARDFSASLTAGAGTTAGDIPVQRYWYLGGTNTVRGQPAGAMAGNSYWLTRTEVGYGAPGFRRIAFFDLGWAGDRTSWNSVGRPASGAGIGVSFLDGLLRADVARGFYPTRDWRAALYLDAKF